jgi:2-polyprenyl-3-methyl-5-hydroxy-6-metoxy-1,4-benzoquinol methylase
MDTSNELTSSRKNASLLSEGLSGHEIYQEAFDYIKENCGAPGRVLDVGCGRGVMLKRYAEIFLDSDVYGCDLTKFDELDSLPKKVRFFEQDLHEPFSKELGSMDLITAFEVIEHLENPRLFIRNLESVLSPGGTLIVSTPNIESWTSMLSFFVRGRHSAFYGKSYPAHITPVGEQDLALMISEVKSLEVEHIQFISNGRMPGTSLRYKSLIPFAKGKRFSDNYFIVAKKTL